MHDLVAPDERRRNRSADHWRTRKKTRGFTLIELLVVTAIIAILAAAATKSRGTTKTTMTSEEVNATL